MADSSAEFKRIVESKKKEGTNTVTNVQPISYSQLQENRARQKSRNAGLPIAIVKEANFSTMSAKAVEEVGCFQVTRPSHQGGREQGSDATSLDSRGGTIDYRYPCPTCGKSSSDCEGHHGVLPLTSGSTNYYVYSSLFKPYILLCLKCICLECGNIMFSNDMFNKYGFKRLKGENRLKAMADMVKKDMPCPHCNKGFAPEYITKKFDDENIIIKKQQGVETYLTPREVYNILNKIPAPSLANLGFTNTKPSSFVLTKIPVIPVSARPPSFATGGASQPDAVSKKYNDIVSSLHRDPPKQRSKEQNIYDNISEFLENKAKSEKGKGKKKVVTTAPKRGVYWIKGFLDGKKGVIRDKIMGKRKNWTARSVLCPGIHLRFGELGVPEVIKSFLTQNETVTGNNYEKFLEMFGNSLADCKISHVVYNSGNKQEVPCKVNSEASWKNHRSKFGTGDEVYRQMKDGDVVLFNRQPTLGADSMMGYTVKFIPGYAFRLHLCDTTKHNADFDGDEGNIHAPQSTGMRMELATFAHATHRIISEHSNSPTIGVVFNGISTAYLMSQKEVLLSQEMWERGYIESEKCQGEIGSETFENFLSRLEEFNINPLSGVALISSLFPKDFYYRKGEVVVKKGILVSGILTKEHVGRSSNSLIQSMFGQYGKNRTCDFITQFYFLLDWYISLRGLTVSYTDCSLKREDYRKMVEIRNEFIRQIQDNVYNISDKFSSANDFAKEFLERQISEDVKKIYNGVSAFVKGTLDKFNPMNTMIKSEAKGKDLNMVQILGTVSQQLLSGARPTLSMSHNKRTLPYFQMNSKSIFSRGFCQHSFAEGLSPSEMFFLAQASRIGLMDTGIRVSETGSIQRKMMKVMEDTFISANGAVVNTFGSEFSAVNLDGFNPINLSNVKLADNGTMTTFINFDEVAEKLKEKY